MTGIFPIRFADEGGVQVPHIPTVEEMENCGWAARNEVVCPRKEGKTTAAGDSSELVNCSTCAYNPREYFGDVPSLTKTAQCLEEGRQRYNEQRGLPKDAHRRLIR